MRPSRCILFNILLTQEGKVLNGKKLCDSSIYLFIYENIIKNEIIPFNLLYFKLLINLHILHIVIFILIFNRRIYN